MIKFSIITPTYNRFDSGYVQECIETIKRRKGVGFPMSIYLLMMVQRMEQKSS
ncbi:MAG: hypothetical protein UT18_C0010G0031 [candidate division CPR2 bacterium GW2011_GWC2_39_10]|uniref:Uncharacterized protein n=1 Tax=candidate division CPR2 bacterium GW2011_GWC2_39_10 TaxID=1618345 RepID=A0A0G0P8J2_UNCC2|nr:MAG: hypothetical protein UT18_C0010G0031 [candidate division CPR2 bacterium GW2011_GWC2_39_10]